MSGVRPQTCQLWTRRRHRLRREDLPQNAHDLRARALEDGHEAAQLEARELDQALRAHDLKAEVGEEVVREDRAVEDEPLVEGRALAVAVAERLHGTRT